MCFTQGFLSYQLPKTEVHFRLTVSNIGCELVSCIFALVWKAKEAATEGENGVKWNILKVSSVQAILASNLEVVICTFGFKCPELGCTRVSPRLCLLFTAGVRSVWRSEDVYTMTHIRQTCTFFTVRTAHPLVDKCKICKRGKCLSWSSGEANKAAFITDWPSSCFRRCTPGNLSDMSTRYVG